MNKNQRDKMETAPAQRENLEQIMRKLEIENAKRRKKGLISLSYGTYVAQRDGWIEKKDGKGS